MTGETGEERMARITRRIADGDVVVLGRVGMDLTADPPGATIGSARAYSASIGGSAGNIAAGIARQGGRVRLLSLVSDDGVGHFCLNELAAYGIDTRHVGLAPTGTRTSLALTETRAPECQTVLYRNRPADLCLTMEDAAAVDFTTAGTLVVTGTALAARPSRAATFLAIERARAAGAAVVLDVDYRPTSWTSQDEAAAVSLEAARAADAVIGNDVEFGLMAGSAEAGPALAKDLAGEAAFTIYKRGADGADTYTASRRFHTPVFPVRALKPTGAGDGFMAGLIVALGSGAGLAEAVRRGAATAAIVVSGVGCAPASPDAAALRNFLETALRGSDAHTAA